MTQLAAPPSAHAILRARTSAGHEAVDAAFGTFSFMDAASYTNMLLAHAHVLFPLEALLLAHPELPAWRRREDSLRADLAALDAVPPQPVETGRAWSNPELHGLLYVLEGSRLGGKMLARQVPENLPSAFLGAGHEKGEWRTLLAALDEKARISEEAWMEGAVAGALRGFGLYQEAAFRYAA